MPAAALLSLGTATLGEAWPAARLVNAALRPLAPGMALAGPALTARREPGDTWRCTWRLQMR